MGPADPAAPQLKKSASAFAASVGEGRVEELAKDLRGLPSTIPGVSQEELAAKIRSFTARHDEADAQRLVHNREALLRLKRETLRPDDFEKFREELEKKEAAGMAEARRQSEMPPFEYQRYLEKKKKKLNRSQNFWVVVYFVLPYSTFAFMYLWWLKFFH